MKPFFCRLIRPITMRVYIIPSGKIFSIRPMSFIFFIPWNRSDAFPLFLKIRMRVILLQATMISKHLSLK